MTDNTVVFDIEARVLTLNGLKRYVILTKEEKKKLLDFISKMHNGQIKVSDVVTEFNN